MPAAQRNPGLRTASDSAIHGMCDDLLGRLWAGSHCPMTLRPGGATTSSLPNKMIGLAMKSRTHAGCRRRIAQNTPTANPIQKTRSRRPQTIPRKKSALRPITRAQGVIFAAVRTVRCRRLSGAGTGHFVRRGQFCGFPPRYGAPPGLVHGILGFAGLVIGCWQLAGNVVTTDDHVFSLAATWSWFCP